jgi:hypothetical protein
MLTLSRSAGEIMRHFASEDTRTLSLRLLPSIADIVWTHAHAPGGS